MKLNIFVKVTGMVLTAVIVSSVSLFLVSNYFVGRGFDTEARDNITLFQRVVEKQVEAEKTDLAQTTQALAARAAVVEAVAKRDAKALKALLKHQLDIHKVDTILATDEKGVCIVRAHDEKAGDSVLNLLSVASALKDKPMVGIERGNVVKFAIRAAYPIKHNGEIIGSVAVGNSLTGEKFVDEIKDLTGMEVTIFDQDTRAATTVMKEGQRAIGTKMDNPKVLESVLQKGESFHATNVILGKPYETAYWPLKDGNGKTEGMFFIGKERKVIEATKSSITQLMLLAGVAICVIMGAVGLFFARSLATPLKRTADFATKVAGGELNEKLDVQRTDEIGSLADTLRHMVDTLKRMIAESEQKSHEAAQLA